MTLAELRKLIADDAHADRFQTRRAYRMSLLVASVEGDMATDIPQIAEARESEQQRLIRIELDRQRS